MKRIETREQRDQSLEWMVKTAQELEHPLISEEEKAKKIQIYNYVSDQVQAYNEILYKGAEYPPERVVTKLPPQEPKQDLSGWLDDDD